MWRHLLTISATLACVMGHGRVLEPPSRASAWRLGFPTAPDYDDDGANCGGFAMQWSVNGGECGICGDAYNIPPPRPHELGGMYGEGSIVAHYLPGSTITTTVELTTSHRGFWEFKLCPDPEYNDQECFDQHILPSESGDLKYYPTKGSTKYSVSYILPAGLVCDHCVLQWRYTAGNNWGDCKNGTQGLGCGKQEQFGACSDISIGFPRVNMPKFDQPKSDKVKNDKPKNDQPKSDQHKNDHDNEEPQNESKVYESIPSPLFYYLKHGYFDAQQGLLNLLRKGFVRPDPTSSYTSKNKERPKIKNKPRHKTKTKHEKKRRQKKKMKYRKRKKKMPYWR